MWTYEPFVVTTGVSAIVSMVLAVAIWRYEVVEARDVMLLVAWRMMFIALVCLNCGKEDDQVDKSKKKQFLPSWAIDSLFLVTAASLFFHLLVQINSFEYITAAERYTRNLAIIICTGYVFLHFLMLIRIPRAIAAAAGVLLVLVLTISEKNNMALDY